MQRCVKCGQWKDEDEFAWRWKDEGIRQKACRDCRKLEIEQWYERHHEEHRERVKERLTEKRNEARQYVLSYLILHPCVECGESDPLVLEFDHIGEKDNTISKLIADGASTERIQKEIDLCQVLCANCHRRKTMKDLGWFRGRSL